MTESSCASSSIQPLPLMRWIHFLLVPVKKPNTESRCDMTQVRDRVYNLIKKHWPVFDTNGVFVPVKNYECVINTGDSPSITIKKILYGPKETPIMWKAIAALEKIGQIHQITDGCWLFKALLAPKPHQEHVRHINNLSGIFA